MSTKTSAQKLYELGCGDAIIQSQIDRGNIQASISNCNTAIKYFKTCVKNYEESKQNFWIEGATNFMLPYYNKLLSIENLVNTYHELYREKYCKAKLICEKLMDAKY
jgi:hypothetical protein